MFCFCCGRNLFQFKFVPNVGQGSTHVLLIPRDEFLWWVLVWNSEILHQTALLIEFCKIHPLSCAKLNHWAPPQINRLSFFLSYGAYCLDLRSKVRFSGFLFKPGLSVLLGPVQGGANQMLQSSFTISQDRASGRRKSQISKKRVVIRVWGQKRIIESETQQRKKKAFVLVRSIPNCAFPGKEQRWHKAFNFDVDRPGFDCFNDWNLMLIYLFRNKTFW